MTYLNGHWQPRFCGGGCCRDLDALPEEELSFDCPALCAECAEKWEEREDEEEDGD